MKRLACLVAVMVVAAAALMGRGQQTGGRAGNAAEAGSAKAEGINLALAATPSTSFVSGHETLEAINDGFEPRNARDHSHGAYGNWDRRGTQWVQYDWTAPISTAKIDVYWWEDGQAIHLPTAARLSYWDGKSFVSVSDARGLGVESGHYNTTTFAEVTTTRLRLEMDAEGANSTGILEWKVYDSGKSPKFPPKVVAGGDRIVVLPGKTYLNGRARGPASEKVAWSKESGPGDVSFDNTGLLSTAAGFSKAGEYVLKLVAGEGNLTTSDKVHVRVEPPLDFARLDPIYTRSYKINSPLWSARAKALIVNWIPHCVDEISDLNLREGGINNFIQAGNKLAGKPYTNHVGYPFSNAWVHNTVEAMCVALQVDPQGDAEIIAAKKAMRAKLDEWIPIILAAQEPDGYMQTRFTLDRRNTPHWTVKSEHEGYVAGYFLESAIAHYLLTNGQDTRLYDAAKRLADCWCNNLGPAPKRTWYDGHQNMEQALVRFGRFVNDMEGGGKGDKYVELAKFLLDSRRNGSEYDQSHLPVIQQYEAVGHAVRAAYSYSAMADVAMETRNVDYQSAVMSLWDNIVNRKYYVTGGLGSGETSEGFGKDYSLRNNAYCESCANCGELFFQWKLNLATHQAKYADLYEETLYNAILGDVDLEGKNFYYQNPLDARGARYAWHNCPCCVGNIPRTLLALPTWMYARGSDGLYVNLFIGSTVNIENMAAVGSVEMVQTTDYPWSGNVAMTVNPAKSGTFALRVRVPDRSVSELYSSQPEANGIASITVNGAAISPPIENGYAVITRSWSKGDRIELVLPMKVQRVKAVEKIAADRGRVALRYGPLVYSVESVDQPTDFALSPGAELRAEWSPDLLGGVMAIKGTTAAGSPMVAIPNYARNNRGRQTLSAVWMRDQ